MVKNFKIYNFPNNNGNYIQQYLVIKISKPNCFLCIVHPEKMKLSKLVLKIELQILEDICCVIAQHSFDRMVNRN